MIINILCRIKAHSKPMDLRQQSPHEPLDQFHPLLHQDGSSELQHPKPLLQSKDKNIYTKTLKLHNEKSNTKKKLDLIAIGKDFQGQLHLFAIGKYFSLFPPSLLATILLRFDHRRENWIYLSLCSYYMTFMVPMSSSMRPYLGPV